MRETVDETERRRKIQETYNRTHDITPRSIEKAVRDARPGSPAADYVDLVPASADVPVDEQRIEDLRAEMLAAAANLDFERAAMLRDRMVQLKQDPAQQVKRKRSGRRKRR
jgi:excinuclease ABC subunit B